MWRCGEQDIRLGLGIWGKYPYDQLINLARLAELANYDVLWCANEKFYRDMWVTLGVLAAHTERALLGTFIAEPYTCHPAMIAEAIASLDEASNGRAVLLLGAGAVGFRQMGMERMKPLTALREAIVIIKSLLAGDRITFHGETVEANDLKLDFSPRPDIPVWVASRGNRILEMAGHEADGVMIATYASPKGIDYALKRVADGAQAATRRLKDIPITVRVDVALHSDPKIARAAVKPMIAGMIKASAPNRDFITQAGVTIEDELYNEIVRAEFGKMDGVLERLPEACVDAFSWAGTPAQVAEKVAAVIDMGLTQITFLPHETKDTTAEQIVKQFADRVMPEVAALMRGD